MQRSSETIGAIAGALAKAQCELDNPERTLTATITDRAGERSFRYASLASGLELVRKALGQQEIAVVQSTTVDQGQIILTTLLVHASGEWISSLWPICPATESSAHMKGAALTYARRYALFTLVGIAGEDDLDAPDIPQKENSSPERVPLCSDSNAGVHAPAINNGKTSAILRDRLLKEMAETAGEEALAVWAKRALPLKNGLTEDDARSVEAAYLASVNNATENALLPPSLEAHAAGDQSKPDPIGSTVSTQVTPMSKPIRKRSKVHLSLVASQSCLVCRQGPCDAHHLKMAQPRSLGRKVSDEFTVPLCRRHHCDLHRHGNERAWWQNHGIDPLPVAAALWEKTHPIAAIPSATTFEPGDLTNGLLVDTRHKNNETNPILHPEAR